LYCIPPFFGGGSFGLFIIGKVSSSFLGGETKTKGEKREREEER